MKTQFLGDGDPGKWYNCNRHDDSNCAGKSQLVNGHGNSIISFRFTFRSTQLLSIRARNFAPVLSKIEPERQENATIYWRKVSEES